MSNGADPSAATAALTEIAIGGGNGAAAITMEQLLTALAQVVGKRQTTDRVMKNKETQTGREKEERWDKPVAKSKVGGGGRALTVRNYRAKKDNISGAKKPGSGSSNNNNGGGINKQPAKVAAARKAAGKQKMPPSKRATEGEKGEDNGSGKEANGRVNRDPERCAVHSFGDKVWVLSLFVTNHYVITIKSEAKSGPRAQSEHSY